MAVALKDPFKISKEPFRSFPLTPESEIKHNRPLRTAVLPEVSLQVFPFFLCRRASVRLPESHLVLAESTATHTSMVSKIVARNRVLGINLKRTFSPLYGQIVV